MTIRTLEQHFAHFAHTGESRALSVVFDQAAPDLFRVALFLSGDRHAAEDLVQTSFLKAIECAGEYQAGRPLLPWLLGILANRLRTLQRAERRQAARRRKLTRDPTDESGSADPAAQAELSELRECLGQARAKMPDPYRQVLELHLQHGLSAKEIAEVLRRPAGTVRTQIVRGMDRLRRLLPGGLVAGLAVPALPAQGLAAVKATVLARAAEASLATTGNATATTGLLVAKKSPVPSLLSLGLVALVLGGATVGMAGLFGAGGGKSKTAAADPASHQPPVSQSTEATDARSVLEVPGQGLKDAAKGPDDSAAVVVLRGRCIDEAGEPIAGIGVFTSGWAANQLRMDAYRKDHDEIEWKNPASQRTDPDGRFEFRFVPPPPYQFGIEISRDGYLPLGGRWLTLDPGTVKDFGDVRMVRGCRVRGRVEDSDGSPRANVTVLLERPGEDVQHQTVGLIQKRSHSALTAVDGSFVMGDGVRPGPWSLIIPKRSHSALTAVDGSFVLGDGMRLGPWSPFDPGKRQNLLVADGRNEQFVLVVVDRADEKKIETVRGVVVDERGKPIEGAAIHSATKRLPESWLPPFGFRDTTGADGTFRIDRRSMDTGKPLHITAVREGYETAAMERSHAWGATGLRLVMRNCGSLRLLVSDAESGQPIENYGVYARPVGTPWCSDSARVGRLRHAGHHAGGEVIVAGLSRGAHLVLVVPKGNTWMHSRFVRVEMGVGGENFAHVKLPRPVTRPLRVERADGSPVAGTQLELLQALGPNGATPASIPFRFDGHAYIPGPDQALQVHHGRTNDDGLFLLRGPAGRKLTVRILGPGHIPVVRPDVVLNESKHAIVIKVTTGRAVRGRLRPLELLRQFREMSGKIKNANAPELGLALHRGIHGVNCEHLPAGGWRNFPIAADGSFEISGIPPGNWKLELIYTRQILDTERIFREQVLDLADVLDGDRQELELDLHHLLTAQLHGRILLNGEPAPEGYMELRGTAGRNPDGTVRHRFEVVRIDRDGRFSVSALPGRYRAFLRIRRGPVMMSTLPGRDVIELRPKQPSTKTLFVLSTTERLLVLGPEGKPRPRVILTVDNGSDEWNASLPATDSMGFVSAELPPGRVRFWVMPKRLTDPANLRKMANGLSNRGAPVPWRRALVLIDTIDAGRSSSRDPVKISLPKAAGY